ncbi:hypothetical protein EAI_00345 [Harpegnathos saltator]|uniref:Uncharacterized protein n=1 Tax=Harpegnathos saltator TaxID=610380 RepID=E2BSG8_HARSA|nr:hypothetical protein EAI_00345 [Harpegnathos saltator]
MVSANEIAGRIIGRGHPAAKDIRGRRVVGHAMPIPDNETETCAIAVSAVVDPDHRSPGSASIKITVIRESQLEIRDWITKSLDLGLLRL